MIEKQAIEEDLPRQYKANIFEAKLLYGHLVVDLGLDLDQVDSRHKLANAVVLPPFNDEAEDGATAWDPRASN